MASVNHSPQRDKAFGRFYGRKGAARVLAEAEECKPNRERVAHWRNRYATVPIEHTLRSRPCPVKT